MASIPKPETILLIILLDMSRSEKEIKDDHLGGAAEKKTAERTGADSGGHRYCSDYGAYIFAA